MTSPTVQFLFDFGSPNAYLCHKVIPEIEARTGVRFEYVPVLLGGLFKLANNRSPMEAFAGIPNKLAYDRLEMKRFISKHKLDLFRFNPHFPVNTLTIMRGAVAAKQLGMFEPYVNAIYAGMWEEGLNLSDPTVIHATLAKHSIHAEPLLQAIQSAEVKSALLDNTQKAFDRGAFGSPTFFVGQEIFFGKDRLRDVEEAIACNQ
ncbi:MAG: 2-hydroxychromene-2-carboxylate isomerase [Betaproteobacteria bacterium]|jgi:2-hydroxychromene-2-carboxylate isomerase|nr:2-hydroxychromene-2-carboxylate isomerase [Betaproteobacteria bacterium]